MPPRQIGLTSLMQTVTTIHSILLNFLQKIFRMKYLITWNWRWSCMPLIKCCVLHIPLAETIKELDNFILKGVDLCDHTKVKGALHLPETWPDFVTGIWSKIPEILCVEITDELRRTTGHMNSFCSREFVFNVFQPNN